MLLEAILGIIAISVVFCCCTLCCYVVFHHIFTEGKTDVQPETVVWEAKHFYDPLPMATPSPPDNIFKPTPYTFKLQNGNGVYSSGLPHAVINPAVLQYPPGHVYDQQRVQQPPPTKPAQGEKTQKKSNRIKRESSQQRQLSKSRSQSPSPSPHRSPRGTINVWSTNTEFHQQPYSYYSNNHHSQNRSHHQPHHHPSPSQQHQNQKQYVQLTQEHYPLHEYKKRQEQQQYQYEKEYPPPDEYHLYRRNHDHGQNHNHHHRQNSREREQDHHRYQSNQELSRPQLQRQDSQHFQAFMATTHATNVYTPKTQRKLLRTTTNFKEDVT